MTSLGQIVSAIENYRRSGLDQVQRARADREFGERVLQRWREAKAKIGSTVTPTGLRLPRLPFPSLEEAGEVARFLWDEGLPGEFPFLTAAYAEQYLESAAMEANGNRGQPYGDETGSEEPTRLFAGLGLAEDTNARFHYLSR